MVDNPFVQAYREAKKPEDPPIFYRGTVPADHPDAMKRIDEPFEAARGKTFVARRADSARNYGSVIERVQAKPEARILRQEDPVFWRLLGVRKPPNGHLASTKLGVLAAVNLAITRAKAAGYDAVSFSQDSDVGTVLLNEDAFVRHA